MSARPDSPWVSGAVIARRYRLVEEAPDRGVVPVWKALDPQRRNREVALSQLPMTRAIAGLTDPWVPSKSDHPDVLLPLEIGRHGEDGYLVTGWREGVSLERWFDGFEHRRPPTRLAWRCFARLCAQMETVHRAREGERAHGWLSPRSLLVTDPTPDTADQIAVMDLGLARLGVRPSWRRDDGVEWSAWLAPEQAEGAPEPSPLADVFALAVVMTELLTGHPLAVPHERVTWWQLAQKGDHAVSARLRELRPELMGAPIDLVAQALCRDVSRRFPDAGVFRKAMRQAGVKMAVESAGTAVIRMPHRIESGSVEPRGVVQAAQAPLEPRAFAASMPPRAPEESVTVPEEVSRYTDAFREAFSTEDFPATEVEVVRAPRPVVKGSPAIAPATLPLATEGVTTPLERVGFSAPVAPTEFPRTEPLLAPMTVPMVSPLVRAPSRPPAPLPPKEEVLPPWALIVASMMLAVAVAAFVYLTAR